MLKEIKAQLRASTEIKQRMLADEAMIQLIEAVAQCCVQSFRDGNKIMLAGNGGSASDAQRTRWGRPR